MQLFPPHIHKWIYFFGLSVVAIGMPVSEFLMSIGQLILAGNWLLEGRLAEKVKIFWKNKPAVIVCSVILMHLLGLFYTSDFEYAFKDIRIKAPMLVLPLIISTSGPLSKQLLNWLMAFFVATVVVGTMISMGVYYGIIHTKNAVVDTRDISIFISHIRFSLLICFSVFITGWYLYYSRSILLKVIYATVITWLIIFLCILDSLTGVVAFIVVAFALLLQYIFSMEKKSLRIGALGGLIVVILVLILYLRPIINLNSTLPPLDTSKLEMSTMLGNPYTHDTVNLQMEGGRRVWIYVSWYELGQAWNERSTMDFNSLNRKGNKVHHTLARYLTSKGLRKDAQAVRSLSDKEIKLIEDGITNVDYVGRSGVAVRIMETIWEFQDYHTGGDINGHSASQRFEFWKAGWGILKKHPLIGVGTGDIKNAYAEEYNEMNSPLDKEHRLRSHNQYLSIAVAFGILGLLWFLAALIYPFLKNKMWGDHFYFVFFLIAVLSFFNEDTLETQPGVTFFAFFNALLLFGRGDKN